MNLQSGLRSIGHLVPDTGRLKKNALIENRFKHTSYEAESAVFLIINDYCDMGNTYLCLGWCFMGVLSVFHKNF